MSSLTQAAECFNVGLSLKAVEKVLELVDSVVPVTAGGATSDELSVATALLRNTTSFLLDFQGGSGERVMLNEVRKQCVDL